METVMIVTGGALNVRKAPTRASAVVRVLKDAEEIVALEEMEEWCRIEDGYVMKQYLTKKERPAKRTAGRKKTAGENSPANKKAGA